MIQHPDNPAIWVSPSGEVYQKINDLHPERRQWLKRRPDIDRDGYHVYRIAGKRWRIHRLVYSLYKGDLIEGKVVCHRDGNPANNHMDNLVQADQRTNISHKQDHGTHQEGEAHPRAVRSEEEVVAVRAALETAARSKTGRLVRGERLRIAEEVGVPPHFVSDILKGHWSCTV